MAADHLPTEIWQIILRYAIAIPIFFDTDPLSNCTIEEFTTYYENKSVYWDSERRRNILRRVCAPWNEYLRGFDHRYVEWKDVGTHVSPSALRRAIRLKVAFMETPEQASSARLVEIISSSDENWQLEILLGGATRFISALIESKKIPALKSILWCEPEIMPTAFRLYPITTAFINAYQTRWAIGIIQSSLITTLHIEETDIYSQPLDWHLPNLRSLDVWSLHPPTPSQLIDFLRPIGQNLVNLFDYAASSDEEVPKEIWDLCPNLQYLQTPLIWPSDTKIPDHFQNLRLPLNGPHRTAGPPLPQLLIPVQALLETRGGIVSTDVRWCEMLYGGKKGLDEVIYCLERGLTIVDYTGVQFQKFISHLVGFSVRRKKRVLPRMLRVDTDDWR